MSSLPLFNITQERLPSSPTWTQACESLKQAQAKSDNGFSAYPPEGEFKNLIVVTRKQAEERRGLGRSLILLNSLFYIADTIKGIPFSVEKNLKLASIKIIRQAGQAYMKAVDVDAVKRAKFMSCIDMPLFKSALEKQFTEECHIFCEVYNFYTKFYMARAKAMKSIVNDLQQRAQKSKLQKLQEVLSVHTTNSTDLGSAALAKVVLDCGKKLHQLECFEQDVNNGLSMLQAVRDRLHLTYQRSLSKKLDVMNQILSNLLQGHDERKRVMLDEGKKAFLCVKDLSEILLMI